MDWEKKTALRDELIGAASDPFNDLLTPGQSLLKSIQDAEVVRKDRYGKTMSAKMKTAREKLPALHPNHATRSDMTIFHSGSASEVHSLLAIARPEKVGVCSGCVKQASRVLQGDESIPLSSAWVTTQMHVLM
jgi:hypothetical protein